MKRYLTGIAAVIIAISAAAFTKPAKNLNNVTFEYNPPGGTDYSQSSVQNKSNWSLGDPSCNDDLIKACTLEVSSDNTTAGQTQLGSSVTITATQGSVTGEYYVSGGMNILDFDNRN